MTNQDYIRAHKDEDIRSLALNTTPEGIDKTWCLTQIEGYQLAKKKLPRWAAIEGLIFPPRLSMEQCSSELTAEYKASIVKRLESTEQLKHLSSEDDRNGLLIDLTGGFGVDFSYMARECQHAIYVEQKDVLCNTAQNNMSLLGLPKAEIWNMEAETALGKISHADIINIDPARRDVAGRKVAAIEDCSPNIVTLQDRLIEKARFIIIKLSPMLDITQALRQLHNVCEVHVVSVKNECKELLFILDSLSPSLPISYHCINLGSNDIPFITTVRGTATPLAMPEERMLLIEPNSSIMKAGLQDAFAHGYGLKKLHPMSHLYLWREDGSNREIEDIKNIPGRVFRIKEVQDFSKQSIKHLHQEVSHANLTIRNFPSSVTDLRKRLKLEEGPQSKKKFKASANSDEYIFATTLMDSSHVLIRCERLPQR